MIGSFSVNLIIFWDFYIPGGAGFLRKVLFQYVSIMEFIMKILATWKIFGPFCGPLVSVSNDCASYDLGYCVCFGRW